MEVSGGEALSRVVELEVSGGEALPWVVGLEVGGGEPAAPLAAGLRELAGEAAGPACKVVEVPSPGAPAITEASAFLPGRPRATRPMEALPTDQAKAGQQTFKQRSITTCPSANPGETQHGTWERT